MSSTTAAGEHTLDSILDQLDRHHQRATYGAVAALVDTSPRSLMAGRDRDPQSSWIVSRQTGMPTGYEEDQMHEELTSKENILSTPESLRVWLENPS